MTNEELTEALRIIGLHDSSQGFYKTIKECVERQIKKKPLRPKWASVTICPNCGEKKAILVHPTDFHCWKCGQVLDWSKDDE